MLKYSIIFFFLTFQITLFAQTELLSFPIKRTYEHSYDTIEPFSIVGIWKTKEGALMHIEWIDKGVVMRFDSTIHNSFYFMPQLGSSKITNHAVLARWPPYDAYVQLVQDTILKVEHFSYGAGIRPYLIEYRRVSPKCDTFPVPKALVRDQLLEDTVMALVRLDTTLKQYNFSKVQLLTYDWDTVRNNRGQRIMWRARRVAVLLTKNQQCFYIEVFLKQRYIHRQLVGYYLDKPAPLEFKKIRCH